MKGMEATHEALRNLHVAQDSLKIREHRYKERPDDGNATDYHEAWIAMRKAVDALVALPVANPSEQIAIAWKMTRNTVKMDEGQ